MIAEDTRISRGSVAGLSDTEVCWAVVDPIWPTVETVDELALLNRGTEGQQAIYTTLLYAQEVDNGGLAQFFGNSSGMLWEQVQVGFRVLGAHDHADLIAAALEAFPKAAPSAEQSERQSVLRALTQEKKGQWRSVEDQVYARGGFFKELRPFWTRYIEAHPDDFFLPSH